MRFLFFGLLGMLSSIVVASPVLGVSDGDFLDLAPSFQQLNSDVIGFDSSDLDDVSDDVSDDIFSHPDINLDFEFLSSGPIAYFDELSSDPLPLESQPTLFENLGPIAYPDNLLSNVANYEDGSFDTSFDGTLVSSVVTAALGPPSCLSLNRGPSKVAFQSLCCEPPCVEDQSWRRICDHCIQLPGPPL